MDDNPNDISSHTETPVSEAPTGYKTPRGVWAMAGIFGIGLVVLIFMSNIDF